MQLTRNDLTLSNAPRAKFMLSVRFERLVVAQEEGAC